MTPDIPRRMETIREFKAGGGKVAAVLPIYYPRELLRAFNMLPVEVWGPPGVDTSLGSAHIQPYICSIVRNALSFILSGGVDVADVILVPHACDSLQGLGSILLDFVQPRQSVLTLYLPRGERACDLQFLAEEIKSLYRKLSEITGVQPQEDELWQCLEGEACADEWLARLHHAPHRLNLNPADFYRLVRTREFLPAETFISLASAVLDQEIEAHEDGRVPVLLSGILPEPYTLFDTIAQAGGKVVADDLACCGRRLYPRGTRTNIFERIAERLMAAGPDAMLGRPIQQRIDHLCSLAERTHARGVIFYEVKFCEPELFDLPQLCQALHARGLRTLVLETELNRGLPAQTVTRIEAFLETLA